MSQEMIDAFMEYLRNNPDEMQEAVGLDIDELRDFAATKGFVFTTEELESRQALIHLMEGT